MTITSAEIYAINSMVKLTIFAVLVIVAAKGGMILNDHFRLKYAMENGYEQVELPSGRVVWQKLKQPTSTSLIEYPQR